MLTDALRAMINNPFKQIFYEKRKKNVLTAFPFLIRVVLKLS